MNRSKISAKKVSQCEARAQKIVETFINPLTDESEFLNLLRWINQDHYQFIAEERAIQKTCGYPLCEGKITNVPKKKYQICTVQNKVYDLTDRKHFCSNHCFKASCYLKKQLFVSPLWVREKEPEPKFTLLKNTNVELKGDEVDFQIERINLAKSKETVDKTVIEKHKKGERESSQNNGVDKITVDGLKNGNGTRYDSPPSEMSCSTSSSATSRDFLSELKNEPMLVSNAEGASHSVVKNCDKIDSSRSLFDDTIDENSHFPVPPFNNILKKYSAIVEKHSQQILPAHSIQNAYNNRTVSDKSGPLASNHPKSSFSIKQNNASIVSRVEKSLREWFTIDTLTFIVGAEEVKKLMLRKGKILEMKERARHDPHVNECYENIYKKLKILQWEDDECENETITYEKPTNPLPDFETLKEQTREMEIRVRALYSGDKKVNFVECRDVNDENVQSVVLPPLHQHAKIATRRNLVLEKFKKVLPDLVMIMGLRTIDLNEQIKQLALTCKFAAHNITFNPFEWNLIGLILIKLLSLQDSVIKKQFQAKTNYINAMLMSYHLENNYLDLLCTWLTDLDEILKNEEIEPA